MSLDAEVLAASEGELQRHYYDELRRLLAAKPDPSVVRCDELELSFRTSTSGTTLTSAFLRRWSDWLW